LLTHSAGPSEISGHETARPPTALEFFAGSGLVSLALKRFFDVVWANDICLKKAAVYRANHKQHTLVQDSIENISGAALPAATLSWASFPCQDLSLAGLIGGIGAKRSGLVWEWLRVIDEMKMRPPILVAENVVGLVSADGGVHYRNLHAALVARNYRVGAILLDAINWIPQSRPRIFVIAVSQDIDIPPALLDMQRNWLHSDAIIRASEGLQDWLWWQRANSASRTWWSVMRRSMTRRQHKGIFR
jgi:DNA (cytosine-5)-methyltransferase 1